MNWPDSSSSDSPLDVIVKLSRYYGADPSFVIAGGGNTSAKVGDRLYVKGSGSPLAGIGPGGFVELDRTALETLLNSQLSTERNLREQQFKQAIMAARARPELNQRPSVEAVLHHLMPRTYVVHTHATLCNMFTCCREGKSLVRELLGDQALWIDDVDPGFMLAQTLRGCLAAYLARTGRDCPRAVLMKNHGLVICGDTPDEVRQNTDWLLSTLRKRLDAAPAPEPFGPTQSFPDAARLLCVIAPALRGLLASGDRLKVVAFDDSPEVMSLVCGAFGKAAATAGPLTPDQIVYCKAFPLWFEPLADETPHSIVKRLRDAIALHEQSTRFRPHVVLVKGLGLFAAGDDIASATSIRMVYADAVRVMAGALRLGGIEYLDDSFREFIENWEVENYRRQVAAQNAAAGRVAGKIALVTGAAQGFGLEIAQDLVAQGACVALADVNAAGAQAAAAKLSAAFGEGRAIGLEANVTDPQSLQRLMDQVIRTWGGLDLLVCNAGVLKAGSVKSQPAEDFDFVTAVNYKGYFLCVQAAAPVLAIQRLARPDLWTDIIQINSKSGLVGSNRNGAYAGSKFGGIGLTQSFALELVEDGIKVNSICPGNFFDGPLWSDPQTGLFVQYLRTGKVPGAKTIEDVRRYYESRVPMGRGCAAADVMKAIYYLIDQKYETGQALPVTGGQVMVH